MRLAAWGEQAGMMVTARREHPGGGGHAGAAPRTSPSPARWLLVLPGPSWSFLVTPRLQLSEGMWAAASAQS